MAKKKKSQRKRNFSYSGNTQPQAAAKPVQPVATAAKPSAVSKPDGQVRLVKLDYLRRDIRTIASLAIGCVALEAVMWVLLQHTIIGSKIFGL